MSNSTGGGALYVDSAVSSGNGNSYDVHLKSFQTLSNIILEPADSEAMRIDSSQRVIIGHTSSINMATDEATVQVVGTGSNDANITIGRFVASSLSARTACLLNQEPHPKAAQQLFR